MALRENYEEYKPTIDGEPITKIVPTEEERIKAKYFKEIKPGVYVDVYDVLKAFSVTCPATQHAIKKLLCPGKRGAKDAEQDLSEAIASVKRAIELL